MSRLDEIKDEYLKSLGYTNYNHLVADIKSGRSPIEKLILLEEDISEKYAAECCQATLGLAKENTICFINSNDCGRIETEDYYNILEFIESKNNIVLL